MRRWLAMIVALLALIALVVVGVVWALPRIQDELDDEITDALAEGGYEDLEFTLDGRDVTVTVDRPEDAREVEELIKGVNGVRVVDVVLANGEAVDTTVPLQIVMDVMPTTVTVRGNLATDDAAAHAEESVGAAFGRPVENDIDVVPSVGALASDNMTELLDTLLPTLSSSIDRGLVTLTPIRMSGTVTLREGAQEADAELAAQSAGLRTDVTFLEPPPPADGDDPVDDPEPDPLPGPLGDADIADVVFEISNSRLRFAPGSVSLSEDAQRTIVELAQLLDGNDTVDIVVVGGRDQAEDATIAGRRAEVVVAAFQTAGIPAERVTLGEPRVGEPTVSFIGTVAS